MQELCESNWPLATAYFGYTIPIITALCAVSILPTMYLTISTYITSKSKSPKFLFYSEMSFFVVDFCLFMGWSIFYHNLCHDNTIKAITLSITTPLYTTQLLMLLGILFSRLYYVFSQTAFFQLSTCTIRAFAVYYIITAFVTISATVTITTSPQIGTLLLALTMLMVILLAIFLVCLFVNKLYQIYTSSNESDEEFMNIITKTTLLGCISITNSLISVIVVPIAMTNDSLDAKFIATLILIADVFTNYVCISLSHKHLNTMYYKICGCCDNGCQSLWRSRGGHNAKMMLKIQSLPSKSNSVPTKSNSMPNPTVMTSNPSNQSVNGEATEQSVPVPVVTMEKTEDKASGDKAIGHDSLEVIVQ